MESAPIYFITGGVRSGKSTFAEKTAEELADFKQGELYYIACGKADDEEMKRRIKGHQMERKKSRNPWVTGEFPINIHQATASINKNTIVLLDCLTTWLNNELFSCYTELTQEYLRDVYETMLESLERVRQHCSCLIIVSNEVHFESDYKKEIVRSYQKILGQLHQEIVHRSEKAFLVEAGIPILMKGTN